jgi:lysophospholipase L1-like esterase
MRLKANTAKIYLFLIGCVLAFIAAEILLRAYNPFQNRVKGNKIILPVYFHYNFEIANVKRLDKVVNHTKNSLGFRGEESPENFKEHLTIITVGGSTTEGFLQTDGKTWSARLEKKAKESFKHIWLNNAGLDGHSTFGHIVLMEDYISKIKPKVVLFLVGINDLWIKDSKTFDDGLKNDLTLNFDSIKGFLRTASSHSEVLSLAYNLYRYSNKIPYPNANSWEVNFEEVKISDIQKYEELEIVDKKLKDFKEKYKTNYSLRLKKLIKLSRENNIQPVLITQPAIYGDAIDDITNVNFGSMRVGKEGVRENGSTAWASLEFYNDVTRSIGAEHNVLVIDLAKEMPKSSRYFRDFVHFNNEGAEKVAEIVYSNLLPFLKNNFSDYSKSIN